MQHTPNKPDKRIPTARRLRRTMTDAERKLWWHLRRLPMEHSHFRRQATIGPYYVDFACHDRLLVIEVDGISMGRKRTWLLTRHARPSWSHRVIGFCAVWNNEVLRETRAVMEAIYAALHEPPEGAPHP